MRTVEAITLRYDLAHHGPRPKHDGTLLDDLTDNLLWGRCRTLDDHLAQRNDDAALHHRAAGHHRPRCIIAVVAVVRHPECGRAQERASENGYPEG